MSRLRNSGDGNPEVIRRAGGGRNEYFAINFIDFDWLFCYFELYCPRSIFGKPVLAFILRYMTRGCIPEWKLGWIIQGPPLFLSCAAMPSSGPCPCVGKSIPVTPFCPTSCVLLV